MYMLNFLPLLIRIFKLDQFKVRALTDGEIQISKTVFGDLIDYAKVKVLNHRWIIADFSDGEIWGEVLLKYFVNDDNSISFEVNQSLLYQK